MKRIVSLLLFITGMLCFACGCRYPGGETASQPQSQPAIPVSSAPDEPEWTKADYKKSPTTFVTFTKSSGHIEKYMLKDEVAAYTTQYPRYVGEHYKKQLKGEDRLLYNCYLYAMENCFTGFSLYVEDNDRDFSYIRNAFSLDSALLEQYWDIGEDVWDRPTDYIGESIHMSVENFTQKRWERRMEALEKCKQIVAGIPASCTTQLQRMEYLYRYVCDHVAYKEYDSSDVIRDYLYDAACLGEGNHDGYSNMLCLLFKLIDVESCEAMAYGEDVGFHTWVVAKVDGRFYNFDAAAEDIARSSLVPDALRYFGFSDAQMPFDDFYCDDYRPKCTDVSRDYTYADLTLPDITSPKSIARLASVINERTEKGLNKTLLVITGHTEQSQWEEFESQYSRMGVAYQMKVYVEQYGYPRMTLLKIVTTSETA